MKKLKVLRQAKKAQTEVTVSVGYRGTTGLAESYNVTGTVTGIWKVPGEGFTIELSGDRAFRLGQITEIN